MACETIDVTPESRRLRAEALARLEKELAAGRVKVAINKQGAIAFQGWTETGGVYDACAFNALTRSRSIALARAVELAEIRGGVAVNPRTIAAGIHSHDGGTSWGKH